VNAPRPAHQGLIVMIDDDADLLAAQAQGLEIEGFSVRAFSSGEQALRHLAADFDGVVLSDVRMPHMDGLKLFEHIRAIDADIPVILLTGHGDVLMAVQALKAGAYDFMTKPFPMDELVASLRRALQNRRLVLENRQLRRAHADAAHARMALLGDSPAMVALRQTLAQIADAEVDVLVTGETGAVARWCRSIAPRCPRPAFTSTCLAPRRGVGPAAMAARRAALWARWRRPIAAHSSSMRWTACPCPSRPGSWR
jgi:two-component system, NtrC family, C4-dicarboxylate transport response regulator DctD